MADQLPTIGDTVVYCLTADDARTIDTRRAAARAAADDGQPAPAGNPVAEGHLYPATVVRVFDPTAGANLHVLLDGDDAYWATSRPQGTKPGTWRWTA